MVPKCGKKNLAGCYLERIIRNGNIRIAPISLITASSVMPIILKGSSNNHTMGKRTSITSAMGQQTTSRKHHSINPMNILMLTFFTKDAPYL
jgi:hypothetical protein